MTTPAPFFAWKMACWCADAARRFNRPDLLDEGVPLDERFEMAVELLHPDAK